jgi:uncharacterized protein (DUF924 family)
MNVEKLEELYKQKAPSSLCSSVEVRKDIAFLLGMNLTEEQIFFSFHYLSNYHPEDLNDRPEAVAWHWEEIKKYFELAKAKQARDSLKRSEVTYDQRNTIKGKDTPQWFRKSFDKHLFE